MSFQTLFIIKSQSKSIELDTKTFKNTLLCEQKYFSAYFVLI